MTTVARAERDAVDVVFVSRRTSGLSRRMESVLASLQTRNRGRVSVVVVDADAEAELVARLGVDEAPAVVFLRGRRPIARFSGRATLDELEAALHAAA
jgi:thioredoxin-like negative regulator of GroEL